LETGFMTVMMGALSLLFSWWISLAIIRIWDNSRSILGVNLIAGYKMQRINVCQGFDGDSFRDVSKPSKDFSFGVMVNV